MVAHHARREFICTREGSYYLPSNERRLGNRWCFDFGLSVGMLSLKEFSKEIWPVGGASQFHHRDLTTTSMVSYMFGAIVF